MAGIPVGELRGRGAAVPFVEHEAESAVYVGELLGPSRRFGTIPAEASGRRAVRLGAPGDGIEFTLVRPANAITVRYALPDSADGRGLDATLGVQLGSEEVGRLALTSRLSWFYGDYPFTNRPSDGKPHHVFAETRLLLGRTLPAGAKVRLARLAGAPWTAIDLADFELVPPPLPQPPGALSIVAFGADPAGKADSRPAIARAIGAARRAGKPVWIPPGTFRVERHIMVDRVAILGSGPWHSILSGNGVGIYGRKAPRGSTAVTLRDFAVIGRVGERVDKAQLAGIGGAIGGGSSIENLYLQAHKVGIWLDGPLERLTIRNLRIVDQAADGINLRRGARRVTIENMFVRGSGDDGIALWSHREADAGIRLYNNTVVAPTLANGIAIYGGRDIALFRNLVADSVTQGGGIHLGNRFDAVPLAGAIILSENLIVRSGSFDPNWRFGVGALWFYALDHPIAASITIEQTEIRDSTLPAVHFIGKPISGVGFERLRIDGGGHALQLQSAGSALFMDVTATGLRSGGLLRCNPDFQTELRNADALAEPASASCEPTRENPLP